MCSLLLLCVGGRKLRRTFLIMDGFLDDAMGRRPVRLDFFATGFAAGSASSAAHLLPLFTPGYADSDRTAAPPALRGSRDGDTGAHDAGVLLSDAAAAAAAAHEPLALAPPPSALRYPPLARLLNGALVALNQARRDDDKCVAPGSGLLNNQPHRASLITNHARVTARSPARTPRVGLNHQPAPSVRAAVGARAAARAARALGARGRRRPRRLPEVITNIRRGRGGGGVMERRRSSLHDFHD